jgi:hypothetical protein
MGNIAKLGLVSVLASPLEHLSADDARARFNEHENGSFLYSETCIPKMRKQLWKLHRKVLWSRCKKTT